MQQELTTGRVFRFYLPLAINSILMMIEMPVVTAGISRLPNAELQLAAFGALFAIAYTLITTGVALTHSGNALGRTRSAFRMLRNFSLGVCIAITGISAVVYFTPVYGFVVEALLGAPTTVAAAAQPGFQLMLMAPFAIGWRRFYHGVLIRHGYTALVGWCTVIRVIVLVGTTVIGVGSGALAGIQVAAAALVLSASVEAVVVTVIAEMLFRRRDRGRWEPDSSQKLTYRSILWFFLPLAAVQVMTMAIRPIIASAMTRMPEPVLSLAAFPVAFGVFSLVYSPIWTLGQVVIALVKDDQSYRVVRGFVLRAALVGWAIVVLAAVTPLANAYLAVVLNVPAEVRSLAVPAIVVMSFYALLAGWQISYQGVLVGARLTGSTQLGTTVNVLAVAAALGIGLLVGGLPGVLLGAIAYVVGFGAETVMLRRRAVAVIEGLPRRGASGATTQPGASDAEVTP